MNNRIRIKCTHSVFFIGENLCCTKCGLIWDCPKCIDTYNENKMIYSSLFTLKMIYRKENYCINCHNKIGIVKAIYSKI